MRFLIFILFLISLHFSAQVVYRTPSGNKYHLESCRMVNNTSSLLSVEKAQKNGLRPCKICNPPFYSRLGIANVKSQKTNGVNSGNRCLGITKKGTRCQHYTRIGNDYCYQHSPDKSFNN